MASVAFVPTEHGTGVFADSPHAHFLHPDKIYRIAIELGRGGLSAATNIAPRDLYDDEGRYSITEEVNNESVLNYASYPEAHQVSTTAVP